MTQNHWSPGADVVNVLFIILVEEVGTTTPFKIGRCATDPAKSSDGRVHAAGEQLLGLLEKLLGSLHVRTRFYRLTKMSDRRLAVIVVLDIFREEDANGPVKLGG